MSYLTSSQSPTSSSSSRPVTYNPTPGSITATPSQTSGTNPSTPLKPVKGKNGFEFPPIWSFPPFYTYVLTVFLLADVYILERSSADLDRLQPNPSTLAHQLGLWTNLVLNWARHSRVWEVNSDSPEPGEVFVNKQIGRESYDNNSRGRADS
jgi:ESCRT-II complex subunit VPS25